MSETERPAPSRWSSTLAAALAGAGAGWLMLAIEELLAWMTLGYWIPVAPRHLLAHAVTGAAVGIVLRLALFLRRTVPSPVTMTVATLATLYALAGSERLYLIAKPSLGPAGALVPAILGLAACALWFRILGRLSGGAFPGLALGTVSLALALAVNRNLVDHPAAPAALAGDLVIVTGALVLAVLYRRPAARRWALTAGALVLAGTLWTLRPRWEVTSSPSAAGHPHVFLVILDTLRLDVFDSVVAETPEGRAFAALLDDAAWFSQAVSAAPWTAPSVGTILTGLHPPEHGFGKSSHADRSRPLRRLSDSVKTLAERLREAGYTTLAHVANPILHPASGIDRGFERYQLLQGPTVKLPLLTVLNRLGLLEREFYQPGSAVRRSFARDLAALPEEHGPLFVWLHFMDPHLPLYPHEDLPPEPSAPDLPPDERLYRDEVRYTLAEVTASLELLRARGSWDQSVLVLVSDHGEMFPSDGHGVPRSPGGEPVRQGHGHALYDELVHVPLVVRPPGGLPEKRTIGAIVRHADVTPTVLGLTGLSSTTGGEAGLLPWLDRGVDVPRGHRFALLGGVQTGVRQLGLRDQRYKLITYQGSTRPTELYDLRQDPGELQNLAEPEAEVARRLNRSLGHAWRNLVPVGDTEDVELDEATRERLKGLGYLQ